MGRALRMALFFLSTGFMVIPSEPLAMMAHAAIVGDFSQLAGVADISVHSNATPSPQSFKGMYWAIWLKRAGSSTSWMVPGAPLSSCMYLIAAATGGTPI